MAYQSKVSGIKTANLHFARSNCGAKHVGASHQPIARNGVPDTFQTLHRFDDNVRRTCAMNLSASLIQEIDHIDYFRITGGISDHRLSFGKDSSKQDILRSGV